MSENEAPPNNCCRRLAHLRRALSENNGRCPTGTYRATVENGSLVRSQSVSFNTSLCRDVTSAFSPDLQATERTDPSSCCCPVVRVAPHVDSSSTRSNGSLSASSLNELDDDMLDVRERGSRTSIANVKSREDLVMSDCDGGPTSLRNGEAKPLPDRSSLKATVDGSSKAGKRTAKAHKRRAEKDRAQKDSSNTKATAQLESPVTSKPKHKHASIPTGSGASETANWSMWNTVRSSRTRLNESCSEQEEVDEQLSAVDESAWQFMSVLSFRRGQRDDSKYRQLSAADSAASSDVEDADAIGKPLRPRPASQSSSIPNSVATCRDSLQNRDTAINDTIDRTRLYTERLTDSSATTDCSQMKLFVHASTNREPTDAATKAIEPVDQAKEQQVPGTSNRAAECDDRMPLPHTEANDGTPPTTAQTNGARPDTSSRPLLFDQDDSDTSNDDADVPPLDEADCAVDCLLHDNTRSGVTEEDAISTAKQHYYASLSGVRDQQDAITSASGNSLMRKQVLYALDPRESSDDERPRTAAAAAAAPTTAPPPPPRRTLPPPAFASASSGISPVSGCATGATPLPSATIQQLSEVRHRISSGGNVQPQQLDRVKERSTTERSTPIDGVGVLLPPPPAVVSRRSNPTGKLVATSVHRPTQRQDWVARFDDERDRGVQKSLSGAATVRSTIGNCQPLTNSLADPLSRSMPNPRTAAVVAQPVDSVALEDEEDDEMSWSDEQTRIMVASFARRFSTSANAAQSDGTSSLGYVSKNWHRKQSSTGTSLSGAAGADQRLSSADSSQRGVLMDTQSLVLPISTGCSASPPHSDTRSAFANMSFVECTSDSDSRLRAESEKAQSATVDRATELRSSAEIVTAPPATGSYAPVDDTGNWLGSRPNNKDGVMNRGEREVVSAGRHEKENGRRAHLLATFLRKSHTSNGSSSSALSSTGSRNAIAKEDDDAPDSPTAFQHRRFPSVSSCSSQESESERHAKRPHSGIQQVGGSLLASLSSFTFPRMRRGRGKKSAAQVQPTAVTSDVRG